MNIKRFIKQRMCNHNYQLVAIDKLHTSKLYKCSCCGLYKSEITIKITNCEYCGRNHESTYCEISTKINPDVWIEIV